MVQLSTHHGIRHLPLPKGKYAVGACDIMTSENFMRCFYPCSDDRNIIYSKSSLWMKWFPSLEYADGYMRFKFARSIPLSARLFSWLTHDPYCPILKDEPVIRNTSKLPVIIFSHGMGACRSTYSSLLTEMASHGYFVAAVEHRDGSGNATVVPNRESGLKEFVYDRKLKPEENEDEVRASQISIRVGECFGALKLIREFSSENETQSKIEWIEKPGDEFLSSVQGRVDSSNPVISGHSFGGLTAVQLLATEPPEPSLKFSRGVAFDSWLHPIRTQVEKISAKWRDGSDNAPSLLFVNCETFQSKNNLRLMRNFENPLSDELPTNVFTLKKTLHYAQTDLPTIFKGSWVRYISHILFGKHHDEETYPALEALNISAEMFLNFVADSANPAAAYSELARCVADNKHFLIDGSRYREENEPDREDR